MTRALQSRRRPTLPKQSQDMARVEWFPQVPYWSIAAHPDDAPWFLWSGLDQDGGSSQQSPIHFGFD